MIGDNPHSQIVKAALQSGIDVRQKTISTLVPQISEAAEEVIKVLLEGGKVLLCGNGGSAAAAQHLAGELCGRFLAERKPLAAIALPADSSILTCIGNDYGYQDIFSRQVIALGKPGDVLIAFSTSGKSPNILKSIEIAKKQGLSTIAFTGEEGLLEAEADHVLAVPSNNTARIQEEHEAIIHAICDLVDLSFS